jgi:hypothetical protein
MGEKLVKGIAIATSIGLAGLVANRLGDAPNVIEVATDYMFRGGVVADILMVGYSVFDTVGKPLNAAREKVRDRLTDYIHNRF